MVVFVSFLLFMVVLALSARARRKAEFEKRVADANDFNKPNIHGHRKFASREELKRAGLL